MWDFKDYKLRELQDIIKALSILSKYGLQDDDMFAEVVSEIRKRKGT